MQLAKGREDALIAQGKGSLIGKVGQFLEKGAKAITGFSLPGMFVESKKDTTGSTIDPLSGLYDEELDQVQNAKEAYALQSGYASLDAMTKQYGVEPTFKFGTKPGDVSLVTGKPYNFAGQSSTPDGGPAFASWDDWVNNLDASRESGWGGGTITKSELDAAEKAATAAVSRMFSLVRFLIAASCFALLAVLLDLANAALASAIAFCTTA